MASKLPSLTALRAFDAAARHLNFTKAADELGVGQPAVSRQINQLEHELGARLFVRRPTVALTEAGRRLGEATASGFSSISRVVDEISGAVQGPEITIDVSIAFASCWLLGRLADFSARYPELAVRLVTRDHTDVIDPEADVVVYYGRGDRTSDAVCLFPESVVPVCASDYPTDDRPATVDELVETPLLALSRRVHGDSWGRLLDGTGHDPPRIPSERRFTSFIVYREAILQHQGIGLAWRGLMDDDLDGGLVTPVTDISLVSDDLGYWVTTPTGHEQADVFKTWLLETAGRIDDPAVADLRPRSRPTGRVAGSRRRC